MGCGGGKVHSAAASKHCSSLQQPSSIEVEVGEKEEKEGREVSMQPISMAV